MAVNINVFLHVDLTTNINTFNFNTLYYIPYTQPSNDDKAPIHNRKCISEREMVFPAHEDNGAEEEEEMIENKEDSEVMEVKKEQRKKKNKKRHGKKRRSRKEAAREEKVEKKKQKKKRRKEQKKREEQEEEEKEEQKEEEKKEQEEEKKEEQEGKGKEGKEEEGKEEQEEEEKEEQEEEGKEEQEEKGKEEQEEEKKEEQEEEGKEEQEEEGKEEQEEEGKEEQKRKEEQEQERNEEEEQEGKEKEQKRKEEKVQDEKANGVNAKALSKKDSHHGTKKGSKKEDKLKPPAQPSPSRKFDSDKTEANQPTLAYKQFQDQGLRSTTEENADYYSWLTTATKESIKRESFVSSRQIFIASTKDTHVWLTTAQAEHSYDSKKELAIIGKIVEYYKETDSYSSWKEYPPDDPNLILTQLVCASNRRLPNDVFENAQKDDTSILSDLEDILNLLTCNM